MIAFGWWLALASIALADAPPKQIEHVFPYEVHEHALDNGLHVFLVPMDSPGAVACDGWVKVGSGDEVGAGHTGFAHSSEHLMLKGTPALPHAAMYGEFRKGRADPDTKLEEAVRAAAFTVHPYGHDTIGYEADIEAMPGKCEYARAFFARWYRPENTNLVVRDLDPAQTLGWIERARGGWGHGTEPPPRIPVEPPQRRMRTVHVDWPTPTAPPLSLNWKTPASNPDDPNVAALQAVQDLLVSDVGPLQRRLVREEGLAYSVSGGRGDGVFPGLFTTEVVAKDAAKLGAIEATHYDAVTPADVARVVQRYFIDARLTKGVLVSTAGASH